jgi:hypothetical protein
MCGMVTNEENSMKVEGLATESQPQSLEETIESISQIIPRPFPFIVF